jgi:hypothetical protein
MIKIVYTFKPHQVPVTRFIKNNVSFMDKLNVIIIENLEPVESVDEPYWIES